jgi:hypothetical protein
MELEGEFKQARIFTNRYARIGAWYVLPGMLVLLLAAVIGVSRLEVGDSVQVFGHGRTESMRWNKRTEATIGEVFLVAGAPAGLRVGILRQLKNKHLRPISGKVVLRKPRKGGGKGEAGTGARGDGRDGT